MWNTFEVFGNIGQVFDNGNNIKVLVITNYKFKDKETGEIREEGRANMLTIWKPSLQKFFRDHRDNIISIATKGEMFDSEYKKNGETLYVTNRNVHKLQVTRWKNPDQQKDVPQDSEDIPF